MLKNKNLKKFFLYFSLSICLSIFLSSIYLFFPNLPNSFDNKLRDYLFTFRGEIPNSGNVVIIDIDEVSLEKLGQWPWSRNKISQIVENLTNANIGIIGFDVVFAENDATEKVLQHYAKSQGFFPAPGNANRRLGFPHVPRRHRRLARHDDGPAQYRLQRAVAH